MSKIKKVVITGWTHGNELTWVFLIKKFLKHPELVKKNSYSTQLLHVNPEATRKNSRYVDQDMNRSFTKENLNDIDSKFYEINRVKEVYKELNIGKNIEEEFIIDMHTTTANMWVTIIITNANKLNLQVLSYIQSKIKDVKIIHWRGEKESGTILSCYKYGFVIEAGPIAQWVYQDSTINETEEIIKHSLDYIEKFNDKKEIESNDIEIYKIIRAVDYPRDKEWNISWCIHQDFQDKNFEILKKWDKIFKTIDDDEIVYEEEDLYPIFINETSYYEKWVAFFLTQKEIIN